MASTTHPLVTCNGRDLCSEFFAILYHLSSESLKLCLSEHFYAQQQLLLSARLSHHNSVCPFVCHMGGSVKNGASYYHQIFTVGCVEDSSFRSGSVKLFHKFEGGHPKRGR